MTNKQKSKEWMMDQLRIGNRSPDIAAMLGIPKSSVYRALDKIKNALSVDEIVNLVITSENPKQLFSPRSKAYKKIVEATPFLPEGTQFRERIWYLANKTTEPPKCKKCQTPLIWDWRKQRFEDYCSVDCSRGYDKKHRFEDKEWILQQLKEGKRVEELSDISNLPTGAVYKKITKIKDDLSVPKIVELVNESKTPQQLISPKSIAYGKIVEATPFLPLSSQFQERIWYLTHNTTEPPKCKACDNSVNWDYSTQRFRTYCSINCQWKNDKNHILSKRIGTNQRTFGCDYHNQSHINQESLRLLSDKKWLTHQHYNLKKPLTKIAKELKVHPGLPAQYLYRFGLSGTHYYKSEPTKEIFEFLMEEFDFKIKSNDRTIIKPREIDILIPEKHFGIEFNGLYWHSQLSGKIPKNYHLEKTQECQNQGIRLIHIFENEWYNSEEIVKSRLKTILGSSNLDRIYARKCSIRKIRNEQSREFLNRTHIQGYHPSSIHLGLFYQQSLVSVMSFSKSRFNKNFEYELTRFASELNTVVIGGASKLFKHFIREYNPDSVVSYSDKRWNVGKVYLNLGFEFSHSSDPNYWYFANNDFHLYSRIKYQKHKLSQLLENFDPKLSEWDNMRNNGFNRIWDCGNDVFVWNRSQD